MKTFLMWVALMLVFAGVYGMSDDRGHWGGKIVIVTVAVFGVIAFANLVRRGREMRAFNAAYDEVLRQIARGELDRARETMWSWAERARWPRVGAISRVTLAWSMLRAAELDDAIAVLDDNEKTHLLPLAAAGLTTVNAAMLATTHGLRGDQDAATAWLDTASTRHELSRVAVVAPRVALARAIWLCRFDSIEEAAKLLDEGWADYEATCTGELLRPLRVVRAFAHATGPRSGGVAEAALPTLRPAYPGEYTFLGSRWPEMAAFLAAHELAG